MNIVTIAYSGQGGRLSRVILDGFAEMGYATAGYLYERYEQPGLLPFTDVDAVLRESFGSGTAVIFVCAAGIAVRKIAPFVCSKLTDSPVLVTDELGGHVIALLSGHIGGANRLAKLCADITGGTPVITTATDVRGRFAVDLFAQKNNLLITDMKLAKQVSAAVLADDTLPVALEEAEVLVPPTGQRLLFVARECLGGTEGVLISPYRYPPQEWVLQLVPRQITVGIGCRKGVSCAQIEQAVCGLLEEHGILRGAVARICSIDLKKDEPGLVQLAQKWQVPLQVYSAGELAACAGSFRHSAFVEHTTGVDNVCERSAVCGSGGRLLIQKTICRHVAVAVAVAPAKLDFCM